MRLWPGRRGRELGAVLAFAWLAYPYTDFALQSNSNDSLIAALLPGRWPSSPARWRGGPCSRSR